MSNEIMDECIADIARELEGINTDIVGHIYTSEFKDIPQSEEKDELPTPTQPAV